jgi:guanylate kinase
LLELDLQGARTVRAVLPEALLVFITPPSWDVLVHRLVGRGTEPPDVVERRLQTAKEELAAREEFDVEVVNDEMLRAAEDLLTLIVGTHRDLHA